MTTNNEHFAVILGGGTFMGRATATDTHVLDSPTEGFSLVMSCPVDITVNEVGIYLEAVTGSPNLRFGLQPLNSAGDPDGSWLGSTNNGFVESNSWSTAFQWKTLGEAVSLVRGQWIGITLEDAPTGQDPGASHQVTVRKWQTMTGFMTPKGSFKSGGSWNDGTQGRPHFIAARNSSDNEQTIGYPCIAQSSKDTTTADDILAVPFILPGHGLVEVVGLEISVESNSTMNIRIGVWDADFSTPSPIVVSDYFSTDNLGFRTVSGVHRVYFNAGGIIHRNRRYFVGSQQQATLGTMSIITYAMESDTSALVTGHMGEAAVMYENLASSWDKMSGSHVPRRMTMLCKDVESVHSGMTLAF